MSSITIEYNIKGLWRSGGLYRASYLLKNYPNISAIKPFFTVTPIDLNETHFLPPPCVSAVETETGDFGPIFTQCTRTFTQRKEQKVSVSYFSGESNPLEYSLISTVTWQIMGRGVEMGKRKVCLLENSSAWYTSYTRIWWMIHYNHVTVLQDLKISTLL